MKCPSISDQTNYAREVAEMALAHTVSDKIETAYRRGDQFTTRKRLMGEWAKYCSLSERGQIFILRTSMNNRARDI
jgi:hypothetical protein